MICNLSSTCHRSLLWKDPVTLGFWRDTIYTPSMLDRLWTAYSKMMIENGNSDRIWSNFQNHAAFIFAGKKGLRCALSKEASIMRTRYDGPMPSSLLEVKLRISFLCLIVLTVHQLTHETFHVLLFSFVIFWQPCLCHRWWHHATSCQ